MKRTRWRRTLLGDGRWVRPRATAVMTLALALLAVASAEMAFYRWATSSYDDARTIAAAGAILRRPLRLESALAVEWREAVTEASSPGSWQRLLEPPMPPPICWPATAQSLPDTIARLDDAVRALDTAIRRNSRPVDLEPRLAELRAVAPVSRGGAAEFVARYNLARGHLAVGDHTAAAEVLEPIFDTFLDQERLPIWNSWLAGRASTPGRAGIAALGFHGRFLAGAIAYGRNEMTDAIKHFRLAINAVNYLVPGGSPTTALAEYYRRVPVRVQGACDDRDEVLTSLDAYAALVAAYMAAPRFSDPERLPPEVRRTRLQIDPDDPFRPVLRYARTVAGRAARSPIPENLLWAASNLQRVYHHNRLDPDPRLAITRAVLLLHITSNTSWVEAMSASGETDVCAMLSGIASQLEREATARTLAHRTVVAADSARAAVAIHAFSRVERDCGPDAAPALRTDVRSAWLRHGRGYLRGELPGLYEDWRLTLENALRPANSPERVVAATIAPLLARVRAHRSAFRSGRVPLDLPASIRPGRGRNFVGAWRKAVFEDIADALADAGASTAAPGSRTASLASPGLGSGRVQIPAGRAQHFLASLNSAIAHAGMRPVQVYALEELTRLGGSGGRPAELAYNLRYMIRSHPVLAGAALAVVFALAALVLTGLHVSWWRYRLLVHDRLYAAERAHRDAARGDPA